MAPLITMPPGGITSVAGAGNEAVKNELLDEVHVATAQLRPDREYISRSETACL